MKKKIAYLLAIPLMVAGLASCTVKKGTDDQTYPTIEWNEDDYVSKGSAGGWFTEIGVGRYLSVGRTYDFTFTTSHATDKSYTVKSSNTSVATIETKSDKKTFTLNALALGDIILTIEDADEMLVYRNIIRIRKAYTTSEIPNALYNTDKYTTPSGWESYLGSYVVTFTATSPITGIMKGSDDYEGGTVTHNFTLEFDEYYEDTDCYIYNVDSFESTSSLTVLSQLAITRAADVIYIYDDQDCLVTWVCPETVE